MADQSSWGMQLAIYAAYGLGIVAAGVLFFNLGVRKIYNDYGRSDGIAVAAGQFCAKFPNIRDCPSHRQWASTPPVNPVDQQAKILFRAGYTYPRAANPFAPPGYEYLTANI